jgi:hypothetical protein
MFLNLAYKMSEYKTLIVAIDCTPSSFQTLLCIFHQLSTQSSSQRHFERLVIIVGESNVLRNKLVVEKLAVMYKLTIHVITLISYQQPDTLLRTHDNILTTDESKNIDYFESLTERYETMQKTLLNDVLPNSSKGSVYMLLKPLQNMDLIGHKYLCKFDLHLHSHYTKFSDKDLCTSSLFLRSFKNTYRVNNIFDQNLSDMKSVGKLMQESKRHDIIWLRQYAESCNRSFVDKSLEHVKWLYKYYIKEKDQESILTSICNLVQEKLHKEAVALINQLPDKLDIFDIGIHKKWCIDRLNDIDGIFLSDYTVFISVFYNDFYEYKDVIGEDNCKIRELVKIKDCDKFLEPLVQTIS